jgi:hypothetical protein
MAAMENSDLLRISRNAQARLIASARDAEPVRGLTHGFYKYPARFSPTFARAAIDTFTRPGQLVLDPHVGGGTSLVEARASGREAIGVDISPLAEFVARVKCTVFSEAELEALEVWAARLPRVVDKVRVVLQGRDDALGERLVHSALVESLARALHQAANDPHHEHDFGAIDLHGQKWFWKFDYYLPDMRMGSDDPSDCDNTRRVLTIMHASEY